MNAKNDHADNEPWKAAEAADLKAMLDFSFAPDWAKAAPGASYAASTRQQRAKPDRAAPRPRRASGNDRARPSRPVSQRPPPARTTAPRQNVPPLPPLQASVLPNQRFLKTLVQKLHAATTCHALSEICTLFLDRPPACDLKLETSSKASPLHQCSTCQAVFSTAPLAERHFLEAHLGDWFDKTTLETDPPTGVFTCVARCGLTGTLLGPPNHHAYTTSIQRLHQSRFPNMTLEDYTRRIETVHDPESIEQWKEQSRTQSRYTLKTPSEDAQEPMTQAEAEDWLARHVIPTHVKAVRRAIMPCPCLDSLKDPELKRRAHEAIRKEKINPTSLKFALRGALRSKRLHLWKSPRGTTYVSSIQPSPLDISHVADPVKPLLRYIGDHPRCTRQDILQALFSDLDPGDATSPSSPMAPLAWLIGKGHVLQLADATLCLPDPRPSSDKFDDDPDSNPSASPNAKRPQEESHGNKPQPQPAIH